MKNIIPADLRLWGRRLSAVLALLTVGVLGLGLSGNYQAYADNVYASIRGTVTDPSGAVLPGVKVTATNVGTGVPYAVNSNTDGTYVFLQLPVGNYVLKAEKTGFKAYTTSNIHLSVNQVYSLNVTMEVGAVNQEVVVEANAAQVETTNIQLQTLVDEQKIVDMPLVGRNWTQLEQLSPGVVASSDRFGTYSANGSQSNQSSYLLNGMDDNDLPLNEPSIIPSPDALSEFNIITNTINPEYGRNSGAIVNAIIKSGSNSFHGDGFEFYRDTFLNVKTYGQNTTPQFHQHQFGGTFGGPIWKNHTFFFFSYQGVRARAPEPGAGNLVPVFSAGERGGDFSDIHSFYNSVTNPEPATSPCGANYSGPFGPNPLPFDVGTASAGTPWCVAFPTGVISSGDFNPISAALLGQYVPSPNTSGNEFSFNPTRASIQDQELLRIDHTFTQNDAIWGTMFLERAPQTNDLPLPGGSTLPGFGDVNQEHFKQYIVDWSHTFSGSALNELRAGYTRFNLAADQPQQVVAPSSVGFDINSQLTSGQSLPFIQINNLFNLGFTTNGPQPRIDATFEVTDNFSKVIGNHALKFGWDGRRFDVWNPFSGSNNGKFTFGAKGPYSTGVDGADFLLGIPDTYGQGSGGLIIARAYESYSYFQDQWKVKPNLTVTLGTGWQVDTPLHNNQFGGKDVVCFRAGVQSTIAPTAPMGLLYPGDSGCNNAGGTKTLWKDFGPRVGFAWAPNAGWLSGGGTGKLSIRAGWGYYFNRYEEESALQNLGDPPFSLSSTGVADLGVPGTSPSFVNPFVDVNPTSGVGEANKFPFVPPPLSSVDFSFFEPMSLSLYSQHLSAPQAMNYNLTIQREFGDSTVVSVGYVGSQGRHLVRFLEQNPITLAGAAACAADPVCVSNAAIQHVVFPDHSIYPGDEFASLGTISTNGDSNYNSLQASAKRSFRNGLSFQLSYTWSHSMDNGSGFEDTGFNGWYAVNPFPQYSFLNWGDSAFDARQRFVAGYSYQLPQLKGDHRWANMLIGGWEFSG
ncbi:MAG TPA: carboxypeptidase-like regulatory domain-containing protein, partial [Terriglobales bacterium]|nr:carboxypeptidase-like regulatory domain-containing protein [Terriglobales bacterium]